MVSAAMLILSLVVSTAALNSVRDVTSGPDTRHVVLLDDCKIRAGKEGKREALSPAVTVDASIYDDAGCSAPVANALVNVTFESDLGPVCRGTAKTDADGQLELVIALSKKPTHTPARLRVCLDSTRCANGILFGNEFSGINHSRSSEESNEPRISSNVRICVGQKAIGLRLVRSVNEKQGQNAETQNPGRSNEDPKRFSTVDSEWDKLPMEWIKRGKNREGTNLGHSKYWTTKKLRVAREISRGEMVNKWKHRNTSGDIQQRHKETDTRDEHLNDGSSVGLIKSGVPELMETLGVEENFPKSIVSPSNPKGGYTKDTKMKLGSNKKWQNSGMAWIKRDNDKKWDNNVMAWIKKDNDKKWDDNVMAWIKKDNDKKWDDNVMAWIKRDNDKKWDDGKAWIKKDNDKKWDGNVMSWTKKDNDKKWDDNVMSWIKRDNDKKWDDNVMSWIKRDNDKKWDDKVMSWIKRDNDKKWDDSPISWIKKLTKDPLLVHPDHKIITHKATTSDITN